MRLSLRGQAHAEWKILVSGDRRNVKDDQYFVDERIVVWGHGNFIQFLLVYINILKRLILKLFFRFI